MWHALRAELAYFRPWLLGGLGIAAGVSLMMLVIKFFVDDAEVSLGGTAAPAAPGGHPHAPPTGGSDGPLAPVFHERGCARRSDHDRNYRSDHWQSRSCRPAYDRGVWCGVLGVRADGTAGAGGSGGPSPGPWMGSDRWLDSFFRRDFAAGGRYVLPPSDPGKPGSVVGWRPVCSSAI